MNWLAGSSSVISSNVAGEEKTTETAEAQETNQLNPLDKIHYKILEVEHDVLKNVQDAEVVGDRPLRHWFGKSGESGCHLRLSTATRSKGFSLLVTLCSKDRV